MTRTSSVDRLLLVCSLTGTFAVSFYALIRMSQHFIGREPNPATILWSLHSGYFWRELTVAFAAALYGILLSHLATRRERLLADALRPSLYIAISALALQVTIAP